MVVRSYKAAVDAGNWMVLCFKPLQHSSCRVYYYYYYYYYYHYYYSVIV